jgi:dienelactone hydrolase
VDDAAKAAALLRGQPEVDPKRVFVLGHSLGGYVAPRIAAEDGKLAGMILMAANARPLEDLLLDQGVYLGLTGQRLEGLKVGVARIKALEPSDADSPALMGVPVAYWLDLKGYDAPGEAKKLALPVLVLQGERDYQVGMKDFALWKSALAGGKDAAFKSYPALNHIFVAGEGKSTEAEYRKSGHVAPEVIEDIAKFVKG